MNIIFFGPQGSGKGTQAKIIAKELQLAHISTGDLVRSTKGELKKEIDSYINKGNLVPDELMIRILKERLSHEDCKNGFILDGFPRNLVQARELDKITKIDKTFEISIPDDESIKRLSARLSCKNCGSVFNTITNPPKQKDKCDSCQSELFQREDDKPKAIEKRLEIYKEQTSKLLKHYNSIKINGLQSIELVKKDIEEFI